AMAWAGALVTSYSCWTGSHATRWRREPGSRPRTMTCRSIGFQDEPARSLAASASAGPTSRPCSRATRAAMAAFTASPPVWTVREAMTAPQARRAILVTRGPMSTTMRPAGMGGPGGDAGAAGADGDPGHAGPDVDHHAPGGLGDGQARAEGHGDGVVDEVHAPGVRAVGEALGGLAQDRRSGAGERHHQPGPGEGVAVHLGQEEFDQPPGELAGLARGPEGDSVALQYGFRAEEDAAAGGAENARGWGAEDDVLLGHVRGGAVEGVLAVAVGGGEG